MNRFIQSNQAMLWTVLSIFIIVMTGCRQQCNCDYGYVKQKVTQTNSRQNDYTIKAIWKTYCIKESNPLFHHIDESLITPDNVYTVLEIHGEITNLTDKQIPKIKLKIHIDGEGPCFPNQREWFMHSAISVSCARGWVTNREREYDLDAKETREFDLGMLAHTVGMIPEQFLHVTGVYVEIDETNSLD